MSNCVIYLKDTNELCVLQSNSGKSSKIKVKGKTAIID